MEYELDCLSTHGLDQGFSLFDGASCHAALAYWIVSPRSATEAMNIYYANLGTNTGECAVST